MAAVLPASAATAADPKVLPKKEIPEVIGLQELIFGSGGRI